MLSADEMPNYTLYSSEVFETMLEIKSRIEITKLVHLISFEDNVKAILLYLWWNGIRGFINDKRIEIDDEVSIMTIKIPITYEKDVDIEPVIKRIQGMVGGIYTAIDSVSVGSPKLVTYPNCCAI